MNQTLIVALVSLIVVVIVHIVVIARWTGRIDGWMVAAQDNFYRIDTEIDKLRIARHLQEGIIQRHEGLLREFERHRDTREEP